MHSGKVSAASAEGKNVTCLQKLAGHAEVGGFGDAAALQVARYDA